MKMKVAGRCYQLIGILLFMAITSSYAKTAKQNFSILLPDNIHGVVGIEMNVYFDNLVYGDACNYEIDVTCPKGMQLADRWTFTPTEADVNEFMFLVTFKDFRTSIVKRSKSKIIITPKSAGAGKKISLLIIGDSLTANGVYPDHLYELCQSPTEPNLVFIGNKKSTVFPQSVRFEGYGGWTVERFAEKYYEAPAPGSGSNYRSPFIFKNPDGRTALDFKRYCLENNNGNEIDIVLIFLGCNDVFLADESNIKQQIDSMLSYYEKLLTMVHQYSPKTKMGLLMPIPPAYSQDAFGYIDQCSQTRLQYKRNQSRLVQRMLRQYERRQDENIFIVETHLNIDVQRSFPEVQVPVHSNTKEMVWQQANSVHPNKTGYCQIGDTVYSWIKSVVLK